MKHPRFTGLLTILLCLVMSFSVSAHSGRTDSSGGHKDNKNASGLGSYHYHCGGYPAHLHQNSVCPYKSTPSSSNTSSSQSSSSSSYVLSPTPTSKPTPVLASVPAPTPTPKPLKYIVSNEIRATINDRYIPFYIYEDKGVVKISDLNSYGFDTEYNSDKKTTTVKRNKDKEFTQLEGISNVKIPVKDSVIKVYLNINGEAKEITGFNGDGNMYIWFSDLAIYGEIKWNGEEKLSALTLN